MTRSIERTASGQIIPKENREYNERLFSKGWRRFLHEGRYHWLHRKMKQLQLADVSIIELGCFDAKTIDYLPFGFTHYTGYDANWENGLDIGKKRWQKNEAVVLIESHAVASFNPAGDQFDCAIAMETLEHLKQDELEAYIQKLASATRSWLFVTVPYERGVPLLLKYLYKSISRKVDEPYSPSELWYGLTGKVNKLQRIEGGHKGFDHRYLLQLLSRYFEIQSVEGMPFTALPLGLNFSVGIVAKPRS